MGMLHMSHTDVFSDIFKLTANAPKENCVIFYLDVSDSVSTSNSNGAAL